MVTDGTNVVASLCQDIIQASLKETAEYIKSNADKITIGIPEAGLPCMFMLSHGLDFDDEPQLENLLVKKDNWQEFQQVLIRNGITTLYHFTDRTNISSIKKHGGLYSWYYCDKHDITISYPGGDELSRQLDIRYNLQDFVRLSFCNDHPMMWRLQQNGRNLVTLEVKVDVSYFKNTCFSDINATDSDHTHGSNLQDLKRIDFMAVKRKSVSREDADFKTHQAEVLVKTCIPLEYITNINDF
ncbi:MAG: DUF4433 domain-containing protein [Prevotellaceae bacterium]|nr:DUF4433 domain-containing protein [Prevotellaceae bacterium]